VLKDARAGFRTQSVPAQDLGPPQVKKSMKLTDMSNGRLSNAREGPLT